MNKKNYFIVDMLGCRVYAIFDKDWRKIAAKHAKTKLDENYDPSDCNATAMHLVTDKEAAYYMFFPTNPAKSTIYHECCHVLIWMLSDFGWEIDRVSHEPVAFLMAYIIDETFKLKQLQRKK